MTSQGKKGLLISVLLHLGVFLLMAGGLPADSDTGRSVHMDFRIVDSAMSGSAAQKPAKIKNKLSPSPQPEAGPPVLEARTTEPPKPEENIQDEPEKERTEKETVSEGVSGKAMAGAAEHGVRGRDFSYIKQLLQRNLKYPNIARRMGWEGKVVVRFIIACNGSVRSIEVVETSGKALLDKNAVDVIKKAVPFPKHNIETKVLIPIVYSLSEGSV